MRNLLSKQDKKILQKEYRVRVVIVVLGFVVLTMVSVSILLLPSYIISNYNMRTISNQHKVANEIFDSAEKNITGSILVDTKKRLEILARDKNEVFITDILEDIIRIQSDGIKISGFFYEEKIKNINQIFLVGEAVNREVLLGFKKGLERESVFSEVILPVSNLAPGKDIGFSITLTIEQSLN